MSDNTLELAVESPKPVFEIHADGTLFWKGRQITVDDELRTALLELTIYLRQKNFSIAETLQEQLHQECLLTAKTEYIRVSRDWFNEWQQKCAELQKKAGV